MQPPWGADCVPVPATECPASPPTAEGAGGSGRHPANTYIPFRSQPPLPSSQHQPRCVLHPPGPPPHPSHAAPHTACVVCRVFTCSVCMSRVSLSFSLANSETGFFVLLVTLLGAPVKIRVGELEARPYGLSLESTALAPLP